MEYGRSYLSTLDARRFCATFSDGRDFIKVNRQEACSDTDICAWNCGWSNARLWITGIMDPIRYIRMPFFARTDKAAYGHGLG